MKHPKHARVRFGKLVTDIVYTSLAAKRVIIVGYGLLSAPMRHDSPVVKKLTNSGFIVFLPRYFGTYESDGTCTFENAADSFLAAAKLAKKGRARDAWGGTIKWKAKQVIFAGGSFGGAAALVAGAKSPNVRKIVAVAAPADWRTKHGVAAYRLIWSAAYKNTWRCSRAAWKKLISGKLDLNAVDYVKELGKKDVMLVHGLEDKIVSPDYSKALYEAIETGPGNHKLFMISGAGHSSMLRFLTRPRIFKEFIAWLKR